MKPDSSSGPNRIYNLVSVVMVALTVMALCGFVGFAAFGPKAASAVGGAEPTLFVLGSPTPTLRYPTPQASWTASPSPTITVSPTASRTPVPSETGTPTDTPTATSTLTPSPSSTATNTPVATITPTRSAFDFVLKDGTITYKSYSSTDCGARIAGAVFNKSGAYMTGVNIHITGSGADERLTAGSHTEYGASGYEYFITNVPVVRTYNLQLEYVDGTLASDVITVTTKDACNKTLALVNFQQVQDRQ